jgi:outer membrane protein assembly factor BamD (BamD/ComL family)
MQARAALDELAVTYPDSSWAARALLDKAALEIEARLEVVDPKLQKKVPAALITYRTLLERYPNHSEAEDALWYLGEAYEESKQFLLAAEALQTLGERFPKTRHEVWWQLGQLYDRRLDDDEQAIAAYRRVPAASRHADDAQRRIARLSR